MSTLNRPRVKKSAENSWEAFSFLLNVGIKVLKGEDEISYDDDFRVDRQVPTTEATY